MTAPARAPEPSDGYDEHGCRLNSVDPDLLFHRYDRARFLDGAKRRRLAPVLPLVVENWRRALRAGDRILCVATYDDPSRRTWASVSSWRSTHGGWVIQHFASAGSRSGRRAVLLAGQAGRIRDGGCASTQTWFRPDNRLSNRLFATAVRAVGGGHAALLPHVLLALPLRAAGKLPRSIHVTPVATADEADLYGLGVRARSGVFASAEDLGHEDLLLEAVDASYRRVGLRRYRRIWIAWEGATAVGAAIAWRGPLGLNFGFLENRCDVLVEPALRAERVGPVVRGLLAAAATAYADFELAEIPLVMTAADALVAVRVGARPVRRSTQGVWLRPGFDALYGHFGRFYKPTERTSRFAGLGARAAAPEVIADV